MSTDELIVQSFEWLADYSQHYAEGCLDNRRRSTLGAGANARELSSYDRGFHHRSGGMFGPKSKDHDLSDTISTTQTDEVVMP